MSCGLPGHHHEDDGSRPIQVWCCNLCTTEFEEGIADAGPGGEPRCPQCLMCDASPIERTDYQSFIIRRTSRFR